MDLHFTQSDFSPCGEWGPTSVDTGGACSGRGRQGGKLGSEPWLSALLESSEGLATMTLAWNQDFVFHSFLPGPLSHNPGHPVESALPVCEELAGGGKFHGALGMWSSSKEGLGYSLCPWQPSWARSYFPDGRHPVPHPLHQIQIMEVNSVCSTHLKR